MPPRAKPSRTMSNERTPSSWTASRTRSSIPPSTQRGGERKAPSTSAPSRAAGEEPRASTRVCARSCSRKRGSSVRAAPEWVSKKGALLGVALDDDGAAARIEARPRGPEGEREAEGRHAAGDVREVELRRQLQESDAVFGANQRPVPTHLGVENPCGQPAERYESPVAEVADPAHPVIAEHELAREPTHLAAHVEGGAGLARGAVDDVEARA